MGSLRVHAGCSAASSHCVSSQRVTVPGDRGASLAAAVLRLVVWPGGSPLPCAFVCFWPFYLIPPPPSFRDKFKVDDEAPLMSIQTGNLQFLTCFIESRQTVCRLEPGSRPSRGLLKKLVSLSRCVSRCLPFSAPRSRPTYCLSGECPLVPLWGGGGGLGGHQCSLTRPSVMRASLSTPHPCPVLASVLPSVLPSVPSAALRVPMAKGPGPGSAAPCPAAWQTGTPARPPPP